MRKLCQKGGDAGLRCGLFARDVVRKSEGKDAKIVPERRGCGLEKWEVLSI